MDNLNAADHDRNLPLVSIGMSVRNNEKTLALAVRSILSQTYQNWELLVIDDGSTDKTLRIAQELAASDARIKVWSDGQALGLPDRLNQTIDLSQGTYFARMDGDDVSYPWRLERQVQYMQQHPEVDLVGAWVLVFGANGMSLGKRASAETHTAICARPFRGFPMAHPTYFGHIEFFRHFKYRSAALRCEDQDMLLRAYGRKPPSPAFTLLKAQDQDLLLRAYKQSQFANVQEVLLGYREEDLDRKKMWTGRRYFMKSLFHVFREQGRLDLAIRAVVEQGLKAIVDVISVTTGLNYRLLRHRAQPIARAEQQTWEQVWGTLNQA